MPSEWSIIEARLENSLGMSKVGLRRSRGIPQREASSRWTLSNETGNPDHVDPAL